MKRLFLPLLLLVSASVAQAQWYPPGGDGGGGTIPATTSVLEGDGAGNAQATSAAHVNSLINSTVAPVFANLTSKPTTAAGYSITNGATIDLWGAKALPAGAVVGTSDTQALTNKDLTGAGNTFPTLNQNTTGSAATLTTGRTISTTGDVIYTSDSFNGSGNVTGTAAVANVPATATHATDLTTTPNNAGGWKEYFVTGSDFTTTDNAFDAITGLTTDTLSASTRYEFEAVLQFVWSADTNGSKFAVDGGGSGSAATLNAVMTATSSSAISAGSQTLSSLGTSGTAVGAFNTTNVGSVYIRGFFVSASAGTPTLILKVQHVTAGTTTVKVGSILRIRKAHT